MSRSHMEGAVNFRMRTSGDRRSDSHMAGQAGRLNLESFKLNSLAAGAGKKEGLDGWNTQLGPNSWLFELEEEEASGSLAVGIAPGGPWRGVHHPKWNARLIQSSK